MPKPPLPQQLQEFLAKPNPSVIATLRPDGSPQTVATWYLWDDGRILVNMDEGRKRLEHLRHDGRVAITVTDKDSWYDHVSLRGRVVEIRENALDDIDRIARHYIGQDYPDRERGRVSAWIEIEHWHAWAGGRTWTAEAA